MISGSHFAGITKTNKGPMKVYQLLEAKILHDSFAQFVYADKTIKKSFTSLEEVEDLFDSAYLDDAVASNVAEAFLTTPSVTKASKEAFSRAKWCIDNMDSANSKWKAKLLQLAQAWADSVATEIVRLARGYLAID